MEKLKKFIESSVTGLDALKRAPIVTKDTGLRCLRIGDISQKNSFTKWGFTNAKLVDVSNFLIKENDVFIARTGSTIGCSYYSKRNLNAVFNNGIIRLRTNSKMLPKFLGYLIQTNSFRQFVNNAGMASATQPNIKINDLLDFETEAINLEQQQHIVDTIGSLDDLLDNLKDQKAKIISLIQSKLKYFTSGIVDFNDLNPEIIKSGIHSFDKEKIYIDTSSVEGINNISNGERVTFKKRPSRANMQPVSSSVWFAKMKGSNKIILATNKDADLIDNNIFSTGFLGIKESNKLPISYLMAIITSKEFEIQRDLNSVGTTMAGINNNTLLKIKVPKFDEKSMTVFKEIGDPLVLALSNIRRKASEIKKLKEKLLEKYF